MSRMPRSETSQAKSSRGDRVAPSVRMGVFAHRLVVVGAWAVALNPAIREGVGVVRVEQRVLAIAPRERFAADAQVLVRYKLIQVRVIGENEALCCQRGLV